MTLDPKIKIRDRLALWGSAAGFSALIGWMLSLVFDFSQKMSGNFLLVSISIVFFLVTIIIFQERLFSDDYFSSPRIKSIINGNLIIVENCKWLNYNSVVSIYSSSNNIEIFACNAYVINIQTNGLIQLALLLDDLGSEVIEKFASASAEFVSGLIIRPAARIMEISNV